MENQPKTRREQKKTKKEKGQHQGPYSAKHIRQQEVLQQKKQTKQG